MGVEYVAFMAICLLVAVGIAACGGAYIGVVEGLKALKSNDIAGSIEASPREVARARRELAKRGVR